MEGLSRGWEWQDMVGSWNLRGRAITNVVRTCGPTPLHICFVAIK